MKKLLTVVAIFITMLCGSIFLVSCGGDYDKMYLVVEYALPTENGQDIKWEKIENSSNFDYVLSQGVYSEQDHAHILYLRVSVKGTKKVNSLYISQSVSNSTFLESNTIRPNEAFKVLVKNIGSVRFTVTPSQGGENKAVAFGVNVYKELTSISQNNDCVPAVVSGGYIKIESLTNLIKYEPVNETNQTGVDFTIEGIGSLANNGTTQLLNRDFIENPNYSSKGGDLIEHVNNSANYVSLDSSKGYLMLNVSTEYALTTSNNVIKLKATSKYHKDISTDVYVYIVENFKSNSLLVSYSENVRLENGKIPTDIKVTQPIGDSMVIYNSAISGDKSYNTIKMYTYTNASIYSFETTPGIQLKVFINGFEYDYTDVVNNNFGIQVSPIYQTVSSINKLVGLKFEVNPNSTSSTNMYNIRLELDFKAFDFSASDKTPVSVLNKEFTITVESLASGFHINGKGYSDNLNDLAQGIETSITEYDSAQPAKIYTSYSPTSIGMPLNIQATPTNAINTKVYVGFYESYSITNGQLYLGNNLSDRLQVYQSLGNSLIPGDGGLFEIDFKNKNKVVYLRFNELADISSLEHIYMVCRVICTPESFGLEENVEAKYITFVSTIDVVGAVDKIYVYKQKTDNALYDTLTDAYLPNSTNNCAYINFSSSSKSIDLSKIEISSAKGNIKVSADGKTWGAKITANDLKAVTGDGIIVYELYFRTEKECEDSIKISSPNGIVSQRTYQFVNTVSGAENVDLQYDSIYMENLGYDHVDIEGVTAGGEIKLQYLALQSGRTVQFKAYGDNKNDTIKSTEAKSLLVSSDEYDKILKDGKSLYATAISTFSASAIRVVNNGGYLFDVKANSVGFTAILLVKIEFYLMQDNVIVEQSKYFVYEIAVYTPARELTVSSDKNSIIYINENYPDTSRVEFNIDLNNATRTIAFSSSAINETINLNYGVAGTKSIYGISVQPSENLYLQDEDGKDYFKLKDLNRFTISNGNTTSTEDFVNNSTRKFSIQALQSLLDLQAKGIESISFDVVIYQFGREIEITKITKVVYLGDYNKAEDIIVVSGVERYNNIYLSLLSGEASQTVEAYATNAEGNVTYKDLGYYINRLNQGNNVWEEYYGNDLTISHNVVDNTFNIIANNKGGVYQLVLYAKDSYDETLQKNTVEFKIRITVSDGLSESTAYLIKDLNDFVMLANDTEDRYYRLYQDIDISALNTTSWWNSSRTFAGQFDGAMTIEDPNSGTSIYKCYSLIGLKIDSYNVLGDTNCFGLFSSVTGTIKNVIFEDVTLDVKLDNNNTSTDGDVNIGVITAINNGTIENCSVNISNSVVNFEVTAQNTTYNIGLIAGLNNKTISYANTNRGSNYSKMVDCLPVGNSVGKLTVIIAQGNRNFSTNTNLFIGGVAGKNSTSGIIGANYLDESSKSIRELIAVVVNIELQSGYNVSNAPMNIEEIDIGSVVGYNAGIVKQVAISGSLRANDKANLGGIVGKNEGTIQEVANYGAHIEGYSWNEIVNTDPTSKYLIQNIVYHGNGANYEQNIGGIIGVNNGGNVDNVRTMFTLFTKDEVSVAPNSAILTGVGNVGGIIGKAVNTNLVRAYVENFVTDSIDNLDYNIVGNNANVAGLIAEVGNNTTATLSFVQADFKVEGCKFFEFGNGLIYEYVYFIGDVLSNDITNNKLNNHNTIVIGSSYIINNVIYNDNDVIAKNIVVYGVDNVSNPGNKVNGFEIRWLQSDEEGVNNNQPYLVYIVDNQVYYTLTIRPTDIVVNVDQNYFDDEAVKNESNLFEIYENGIYLQYLNDNATPNDTDDDYISATAIVYYIEGGNNTHKLVSDNTQKGLIEKTVLPTMADGTYSVSIVSGSNIASLTDNDATITFEGVGKVELKFVSLFDRTKVDTVVIFVENPLNSEVFDIATSAGIDDRNQEGKRFTTRVGVNSLLSLNLKDVNGQKFDTSKIYMSATIDNQNIIANGKVVAIDNLSEYFTIASVTEEIETDKYALGQFNISALDLDPEYSYMEIPVTLNVYLNISNYSIGGVSLSSLMGDTSTLLSSKNITIIVYNKATSLTVSSDVKAEAGESVDIISKLTTGYINKDNINSYISTTVTGSAGNKLLLDVEGQDKIEVVLTALNKNAQDLLKNAKENSENPAEFSVWNLFKTLVNCELIEDKSGYIYTINLRLLDKYRYLNTEGYDEREWKFKFNITASSNTDLTKNVEVAFVPQSLIGLRIENYSNLVARNSQDKTIAEFISSQTESSLIIPSESGLVKIFADYEYSYFENITISSSRQIVDNKEYFIRYQQMVYNKEKGVYESYAGITADGETLTLKKVSYTDGSYEGVLFVRTILDEIVGVRKTFTITVNANTYDLDGNIVEISRDKTVVSQYRPGVYISVTDTITDEKDDQKVYLVEQGSSSTTIIAKVYGYEFNVQPIITKSAINDGETISGEEVAVIQQGAVVQDNTGAYVIKYTVAVNTIKPFKISIKMALLDDGNTLIDKNEDLVFYPVPYIINDVYLKGEANGGLSVPINTSKNIELVWSTKSTTTAKIEAINQAINEDIGEIDYLKLFYMYQINSSGQDDIKYFEDYLNATGTNFSIKKNDNGIYRIESLIKVAPMPVYFSLWYGYDLDNGAVKFSLSKTPETPTQILHEFTLNLTMHTTEDAPNPITSASDLLSMAEGENYILMEDITLENWTPLNTAIASLDGNGKLINIKSFNVSVSANVNVGLFDTVSDNTILKNIVINISTLQNNLGNNSTAIHIKDDNITSSIVNFGLLAGINNGLIYNCEILSINSTRKIEVIVGDNYTLTFGGLVGINQGNITNSRVGTEYFERISYTGDSAYSSVVYCGQVYLSAKGSVAGFVGTNKVNSIISSSFVANTSVENSSNSSNNENNRTAGFVATNEGTIAYSYVKGLERNILTTKSTTASINGGAQCVILASGSGNVAGFAYYNSGEIHDCYSNTVCVSNSAAVAGFVYNTLNGSVYQCYSASKVESGSTNTALATELPFVGVGIDKSDAQQLLSSDEMTDCYYLDDGTEYDENYKVPAGAMIPKGLTLESFSNSSYLNNFSFIDDISSEQQLNAVWTYSTAVDSKRSTYPLTLTGLPELTSANSIARSIRAYVDEDSNTQLKNYKYATGYEQGSKNNPYIIRSVQEYKEVFVENAPVNNQNRKYITGYVRFIDDISFVEDNEYINIETRSNYILGDKNLNTFTVVDGNGMTISEVVINYSEDEKGNLGLFSEVYNSVIKELNIKYASQTVGDGDEVGSSTATFVGGLAGTAKNAYFIDLDLSGDITLRAHNVVGGVVGRITGANSGLYNITTNLNVQAGNYSNSILYKDENTEAVYLSYAGGIAGIIDIGKSNSDNFNLNRLTVSANVRANRAGGMAGFMGEDVNAKRLIYVISTNSQVFGHEVAGGIVADNYADIQLSQANSSTVEMQYEYDKKFAEYINTAEQIAIDNSDTSYGNLNAVTGDKIVGGFIGVNYGGKISNSLTKANIGHNDDYGIADIAGGFVGKSYGGDLQYVYAQNYIDLIYTTQDANNENVTYYTPIAGGIVGHLAYDIYGGTNNNESKYFGMLNVVSNIWFDKTQVNNLDTSKQTVDYLVGSLDTGITICQSTSNPASYPEVSYGVFNADDMEGKEYKDGKIINRYVPNAKNYSIEALYYVSTGDNSTAQSTQQELFNTLFAVWPEDYWQKVYTRFMPNLKMDNETDYIVIDEFKDIALMEQLTDRNFILTEDVQISANSNYVVNANFRGVLIGTKKENSDRYTQFIISLNASTENDLGAGFFKQTTNARIANIGFNYEQLVLNGEEYQMVGGVSALDNNSRFEQIVVSQTTSGATIKTSTGASVVTVGSIVGESTRSNILSCQSNIVFDLNVNETSLNNTIGAYIGGLVGNINGYYYDEVEQIIRYDGLISASEYSGKIMVKATEGVTVGGIVANSIYTRISDSIAMVGYNETDKTSSPIEIAINSVNTNYIGGIVGNYDMCSVANSYSNITVLDRDKTNTKSTTKQITYFIGGIVGQIGNSATIDRDIDDCYSYLTYDLVKAIDVYVGGIVGNQASNNENGVALNRLVSSITILSNGNNSGNAGIDIVKNMTVGGIVALSSGNPVSDKNTLYGTTIKDCVAFIEGDIDYNSSLYGGGLIGKASGSYSINNSTATGYIWANNLNGVHMTANSTTTLTVLGGLVGLADEVVDYNFKGNSINQQINNSYSVLTLSTAGVYQGDIINGTNIITHDIHVNAVVGYTDTINEISGSGILYSSDYTLNLDVYNEDDPINKFVNEPKNVTANVLLLNADTLQPNENIINGYAINGFIGDKWLWSNDHLPMPQATQNLLIEMGIMEYIEGSTEWKFNESYIGKPYYPIIINNQSEFNNTKFNNKDYTYYSLQTDISITANNGNLNGVILGNNRAVNSSINLFASIQEHSAVNNLTFTLRNDFNGVGSVAQINNGTIFMVGVQYEGIMAKDGFGGIISQNNGVIKNCYNIGNANANGNVAGLIFKNNLNAIIKDCYFTGSFNGGSKGFALAYINDGCIANSYSAGMASAIIGNLPKDALTTTINARYVNVYYDYYANYINLSDYDTYKQFNIIGVETKELQAIKNISDSALFERWKVYSIYNLDRVKDSSEGVTTTYNYGYPIHNIQQLTYEQSVKPIAVRIKQTGDGTFAKIVDEDGHAIVDTTEQGQLYLRNNTKGKLVYDEVEKSYYDNFAFLINNLGVLNLINSITSTNKYFELELNIVLPSNSTELKESEEKLLSDWKGLGNSSNPFTGVFTTTSEDYEYNNDLLRNVYTLDRTLLDETIDENNINFHVDCLTSINTTPKVIKNLTGGALFTYVENGAFITGVSLEDSRVNIAPLINTVGKDNLYDDSSLSNPTIYNIRIVNKVIANKSDRIIGLVNKINENNVLNIHSIDDNISLEALNEETGVKASFAAGVININNGTVNIKNSLKNKSITINNAETITGFIIENGENAIINFVDAISYTLNINGNESKSTSGLVYSNSGKITTQGDNHSSVILSQIIPNTDFVAGLVGTMRGGEISGIYVEFANSEVDAYKSKLFGGVVARLQSGDLGTRDENEVSKSIVVKLTTATANIFGGVIGIVENQDISKANGNIKNVQINTEDEININGNSPSGSAYGVIIGQYLTQLDEIYYTLQKEVKFKVISGTNVGAIIGYAENGVFNFTNEINHVTTVYGMSNIGGFIGQYKGETSLKMMGKVWAIGGSDESGEYARIEFASPEKLTSSGVTSAKAENFGGIIGFWNSKENLECSQIDNEGSSTAIPLVNNNTVLTFANSLDSEEIYWFKNIEKTQGYDYVISNIGGVVGKTMSGIANAKNKAIIGVELEQQDEKGGGVNPIYSTLNGKLEIETTINKIMQFMYIGGIAGLVTCEEQNYPTLTNCVNSAGIYGMYAVGGIVGGTDKQITFTEIKYDEPLFELAESANIYGLVDVGGIIGRAADITLNGLNSSPTIDTIKDIDSIITFEKIVGITNVGGIVGNATGKVEISSYRIGDKNDEKHGQIIGNMNVGGIIGYSSSALVSTVEIDNVTVYGSIFDYKYKVDEEMKAFYYLPTNIGGVVGQVLGTAKFNLVTTMAGVKTDSSFKIGEDGQTTYEVTVNMTSNNIGKFRDAGNYYISNVKFVTYLENYYTTQLVRYDAVDGGIGGFAGKLRSQIVEGITTPPTFVECYLGADVYASYGINVGGMIGYLECDPQIVSLPKVKSSSTKSMNVAGRLFVGGYIGKSTGFGSEKGGDFFTNNAIIKVNVQRYLEDGTEKTLTGNCIGGVIGYVMGNVYNIKITSNSMIENQSTIKVFNSCVDYVDSMYVGALIGRIDGNMKGCEIDPELCDAKVSEGKYYTMAYTSDSYTVRGIIQNPNTYNYGGLAGLVDIPKGSKGDRKVEIWGEHYYPFTVEMVQNRDYEQGVTDYNYIEADKTFTAISHYVNLSDINISLSFLTDLYNNDSDNHNPTNPEAKGWAKEYTLFRTFARIIEQSAEPTGDSLQMLYSAEYVTEVGTDYMTVEQYEISNNIKYTIYQPLGQTARLYCKYGIAKQDETFKDEMLDIDETGWFGWFNGDYSYEKNYSINLLGENDRNSFWQHIDTPKDLGIDANWGYEVVDGKTQIKIEGEMDSEADAIASVYQYTFGYSYFVSDNYLSEGEMHFVFDTIFGYVTVTEDDVKTLDKNGLKGAETKAENYDLYSNSGSIFEVSGTSAPIRLYGASDPQKYLTVVAEVILFIAMLALEIISLSTSPGMEMWLGTKGSKIAKWCRKIYDTVSKFTMAHKEFTIVASFALAFATVSAAEKGINHAINMANAYIEASFDNIENISSGYLTNGHGRSISWQDGELITTTDIYMPIPIVANLDISGDLKYAVNQVNKANSFTEYEKFLINQTIDADNEVAMMTLNYYNCSTSRAVPGDINNKAVVQVEQMEGDTNPNSANYNILKRIFTELGITSYSVPKYTMYGNELYCFNNSIMSEKKLMSNFEESKNVLSGKIPEGAIIERNGYAYILNKQNSAYQNHIIGEEDEEFLKEEYNVERVVSQAIDCTINSVSSGAIKSVDLNSLLWEIDESSSYSGGLKISADFKYAGTTVPDTPYIAREAKIATNGKVYYLKGSKFVSVIDGGVAPTGEYVPATAYFTLTGTGRTSISATLRPSSFGNILYNDLKAIGKAPLGNYYYHFFNEGIDNENTKVAIAFEFALSKYFDSSVENSEDNIVYELKPMGNEGLDMFEITLYKFNPNAQSHSNPDTSVESYFSTGMSYTYQDIYEALKTGNDELLNYSISNQYYNPVKSNYAIKGDDLCIKTINSLYLTETNNGIKYVYSPVYKSIEMQNNFINKYVYTGTCEDSQTVKFYTRFNYDYSANEFLNYNVTTHEERDDEGNITNSTKKTISELLLPKSTKGYENKKIIFSEGCRITLSASGRFICYGYQDGKLVQMSSGTIYAEYSLLNQAN